MEPQKIPVSEFKKHCLHLLQDVKSTGVPIVITKRSMPMVSVIPVEDKKQATKSFFGCLNSTVTINADIVNFSTQEEWDINND